MKACVPGILGKQVVTTAEGTLVLKRGLGKQVVTTAQGTLVLKRGCHCQGYQIESRLPSRAKARDRQTDTSGSGWAFYAWCTRIPCSAHIRTEKQAYGSQRSKQGLPDSVRIHPPKARRQCTPENLVASLATCLNSTWYAHNVPSSISLAGKELAVKDSDVLLST